MQPRATTLVILGLALASPAGAAGADWVRTEPGQRATYGADGDLRQVELDEDRDGRYEIVERYSGGARRERCEDRDGDGRCERAYSWTPGRGPVVVEELPGEPRRRTAYDPGGAILWVEEDADRDGEWECRWSYDGGALVGLAQPGRDWTYRDGVPVQAVVDADGDGVPERVERYGPDGRLTRVEELGAGGAGKRVWHYGPDGAARRLDADTDGDGRFEEVRTYRPDGAASVFRDRDGDGTAELREIYNAGGTLVGREEDLDGDGTFDIREGPAPR